VFDLVGMIERATNAIGNGAIALAAPYEFSEHHCRTLAEAGLVVGYIQPHAPPKGCFDPTICGWWVDRTAGQWFLRDTVPDTVLLVNARPGEQLSGQMLLEARLKGVRRVCLADITGVIIGEIDTAAELIQRLAAAPAAPKYGAVEYKALFDLIYTQLGERFRLPSDSFVQDRVMLLVGSLGPGGAERQTAYTAAGLARRGVDVVVGLNYLEPPNDLYRPIVENAGAKICVAPVNDPEFEADDISEFRSRLAEFDNLAAQAIYEQIFHYAVMMRAVRPALVHAWLDYGNVLGGVAAEIVGVPHLVVSGRNVAPDNFTTVFQPYMKPGYESLYVRRKLLFLNNSLNGARDYARWLSRPEAEFRVVHNGFEFPETLPTGARETVRRAHDIPTDAFVIGTMARFSEEKNPRLFVETARLLHGRHPELRFLAYGVGELLDEMRGYVASLGLSEVILLPGVTRDSWSAMAAMDLFLLTSRMEGLPNVLVEAQGCGLPVVCTAVGGAPETLIDRQTGFAVASQSAEELARVVERLYLDADLRTEVARAARCHARETFSVDCMIDATLAAYRELGPTISLEREMSPKRTRLQGPFAHGGGFCWVAKGQQPGGNDSTDPYRSELCLYEDGRRLTWAHERITEIERLGGGRYTHWSKDIYFSSPDGSDPNTNGKVYEFDFTLDFATWDAERLRIATQRWNLHPNGDYFRILGGDRLPPPYCCNIGLTNKCNLRCEICGSQKFLDETGSRRRHMDFGLFEKVAETLFPLLAVVELNSQGDPLLHPRIEDVLRLIAHYGCDVKIQHNGTLLTDRIIDLLLQQHGTIMLSLDAIGAKFDEVRRGGNWAKAAPGLERLLRERDPRRLSIGVYPTLTCRTIGEALNVAEWCLAHDVDTLAFHRYSPIQNSFELAPTDDEYNAMKANLRRWCAERRDPVTVLFEGECLGEVQRTDRRVEHASPKAAEFQQAFPAPMFPVEYGQGDPVYLCASPRDYVEIGLDGQISACCRAQDVAFGYATSPEAFADAWFGRNYQRLRRSLERASTEPYPLPNCDGCVKFFAPKAAGDRLTVDYGRSPTQWSPIGLDFTGTDEFVLTRIAKDSGHCYIGVIQPGIDSSEMELWEDDRRLGPPVEFHDEVRRLGMGCYCMGAGSVYFSTSDNSDIRLTDRIYKLIRRSAQHQHSEVGVQPLPASPDSDPARGDHGSGPSRRVTEPLPSTAAS
jgi:glycosyltransferase involved in cell wall biosynthesis/MoaA/NifB/PqqE/SkfB family radical SAM enzyme